MSEEIVCMTIDVYNHKCITISEFSVFVRPLRNMEEEMHFQHLRCWQVDLKIYIIVCNHLFGISVRTVCP